MPKLMIVVGSVREGRIGLPIAQWVRGAVERHGGFEIDWADLKEIGLPLMTEPNHPRLRQYTQASTIAWSERVDAADALIFVQPEYNFSYSPALKNAMDHLSQEWWRKPLGTVSYGGISGGTRGIGLKGGHQFDTLTRFLQLAQDPKMIAAKGACPGHSYPQNGFARDDYASLPSTAFRQRL